MKTRFSVFALHLLGSMLVSVLVVALVFLVWYPQPLYQAVGVVNIVILLLGVNMVIGPLLTFIVFKPGKKSLRFDLAVIICLQALAFAYGLWVVAEGRPAWLVFNADRFDLVQVNEIDLRKISLAAQDYRSTPWLGPRWVSTRMPKDVEERNTVTLEAAFSGVDMAQRPDFYRSLELAADEMRAKAQPMEDLLRYNPVANVDEIRSRWPEADAFLPLMARVKPMTVLIRRESAEVVAIVDLNPWE